MPDKTFSALANAGKMNRFRVSCDQFARSKLNAWAKPEGRACERWRVHLAFKFLKRNRLRVSMRFLQERGYFDGKEKFSISSATGRTRCGERPADHAVGLRGRIFDYGTRTCAHAARGDRNLRARRREGRADRCHSVYHTEPVEGCFALSTFR